MDAIKEGMLASAKAASAAERLGESLFGGKQKFNSQICTTREQSERILALGLKKETADMSHTAIVINHKVQYMEHCSTPKGMDIPAWSLHRLIEMTPSDMRGYMCKNIFDEKYAIDEQFDELIATIGYYIKEGYFNKKYLV